MEREASRARELLIDGDYWTDKVYLNSAAEGLPLRACADAVQRYLADKATGEPGRVGMFAAHAKARELAGQLCGVEPAHVAIVSSTTEALNTIANGIDWRPGDEVVFTAVEFPSNMCPWVALAKRGVNTRVVHPRNGLVATEDLLAQISPRTRLVTLSQVSYATGQHLDPRPVWDRVKNSDTLLCVDATQAAGRVPVDGAAADFLVASTFKWLNSIHGAAILTASQRAIDANVAGPAGWFSAENVYAPDRLEKFHPKKDAGRFHAGMPNFDSLYALAAALEYHRPQRIAQRQAELAPLVSRVASGLRELGLPVLTPESPQDQAGIVAFGRPTSDAVKRNLAERRIYIHGDDGRVRSAIHWYNTPEHVERYLAAVAEVV